MAAPLTISGSNSITLDTLWKPSTVTVGTGIQGLVDLTYLSSNFSTTASVNTSLAAKQPMLTTGAGTFLNGATLSSYTLRWNGSSTPSVATAIQELHWDNYTMTETVNIGTGKIELTIGHPTDKGDADLDKHTAIIESER